MNTIDRLCVELASNPANVLCEEWLYLELLDQRDMIASEARRHIAEVKRVGRICAELLQGVNVVPPATCRRKKGSR